MIPTGLHDNIIYQTGSFVKTFQDEMESLFQKAGFKVTVEQFNILTHLWYQDGLSQQRLAEIVGRDKTTVSRVLNNMIKGDLIRKVPGSDKRERLVYLTEHGQSIQNQLVEISGQLYMKAILGIQDQNLLKVINTLVKMSKNLE